MAPFVLAALLISQAHDGTPPFDKGAAVSARVLEVSAFRAGTKGGALAYDRTPPFDKGAAVSARVLEVSAFRAGTKGGALAYDRTPPFDKGAAVSARVLEVSAFRAGTKGGALPYDRTPPFDKGAAVSARVLEVSAFRAGTKGGALASSQPSSRPATTAADLLTPAQLKQEEQALGWWLGGAGTIGVAAGTFALLVARESPGGPTHDLERSTGTAFVGLGVAVLIAGIYVMTGGDPGPCEIEGTALGPQRRP